MKRAILIITAIFLISEGSDCQWYQEYFKVTDPDLLSQEQVNMAFEKSQDGIRTGIALSVISSIGIVSGVYFLAKDYKDEKYPDQAEIGKKFQGALLALVSVPPEIIGLIILRNNRFRRTEIEKHINNTKVKVGLINCPSERFIVPGLSVKFRF